MPYEVRQRGDKWLTVNARTGKVYGTHDSKAKAEAQERLLRGVEYGWKPSRKYA